MVFLTVVNLVRSRGRDPFFKKQQILKQAGHFFGRRRNCYSITIRAVEKALQHAMEGRKQKKKDRKMLWIQRVAAAAGEQDATYWEVRNGLAKCDVALNNKVMSELAVFEPRTFKCLTEVAKMKEYLDLPPQKAQTEKPPPGVITRGML